jgi:hypothetical protein
VYSTCTFCHGALGTNDVIEHFPVGRRLAFDGDRGRLWAVCPSCRQWNLAPIEERWEAIEACERAYRGATRRVSSDNIALARVKEGTDLVRIGQPLLPEFAAWRYGGEYIARHRSIKRWLYAPQVLGMTGMATLWLSALGVAVALRAYLAMSAVQFILQAVQGSRHLIPRTLVLVNDGTRWAQSTNDALRSRVCRSSDGEWTLGLFARRVHLLPRALTRGRHAFVWLGSDVHEHRFNASEAVEVLPRLLAAAHRYGADRDTLDASVNTLTTRVHHADRPPREIIGDLLGMPELGDGRYGEYAGGRPLAIVPPAHRFAVEMALHEDDERRLLAGELAALYARWQEAERIAHIADGELTQLTTAE